MRQTHTHCKVISPAAIATRSEHAASTSDGFRASLTYGFALLNENEIKTGFEGDYHSKIRIFTVHSCRPAADVGARTHTQTRKHTLPSFLFFFLREPVFTTREEPLRPGDVMSCGCVGLEVCVCMLWPGHKKMHIYSHIPSGCGVSSLCGEELGDVTHYVNSLFLAEQRAQVGARDRHAREERKRGGRGRKPDVTG